MNPENPEKEPQFVDLFSHEIEEKLKAEGKIYRRKIEPIRAAEQVQEAQPVETKMPNGTIESTQDAKPGDWIITGSKGERFVFTDEKFHKLYEPDKQGGWIPKERKIIAMQNPFGERIRISAPWGSPENPAFQDGSENAVLAVEIGSDGTLTKDRYIIGDEEMLLNNYESVEK